MSRGPGQIERTIGAIFDSDPTTALTTTELACLVYRLATDGIRKEHRVAIIRAGKRLTQRRPELRWVQSSGSSGRTLVFYRHDNELSHAAGREKGADLPLFETVRIQGGGTHRMEIRHRQISVSLPKRGNT